MAYPEDFPSKKLVAYVNLANAIASELPSTAYHEQRMVLAKQMSSMNPPFDSFITVDLNAQGYDDSTPLATIEGRISALLTNLVSLGYGA